MSARSTTPADTPAVPTVSEAARQAERQATLDALADDQLRASRATLAAQLRRLGDAAYQEALDLDAGELRERPTFSRVHARYHVFREAAAMLAATRRGAQVMRDAG